MPARKIADFEAASTGGPFRLSAHAGSIVVLYFYPKDNTPGCTTEGADFRDLHGEFRKAGAVVAGVSRDSMKSHEGFKAKMAFPFELISDPDEKLPERVRELAALELRAQGEHVPRGGRFGRPLEEVRRHVVDADTVLREEFGERRQRGRELRAADQFAAPHRKVRTRAAPVARVGEA